MGRASVAGDELSGCCRRPQGVRRPFRRRELETCSNASAVSLISTNAPLAWRGRNCRLVIARGQTKRNRLGAKVDEPHPIFCHSERSEESNGTFAPLRAFASPPGFFAPLRMTNRVFISRSPAPRDDEAIQLDRDECASLGGHGALRAPRDDKATVPLPRRFTV